MICCSVHFYIEKGEWYDWLFDSHSKRVNHKLLQVALQHSILDTYSHPANCKKPQNKMR